MGDLNNLLSQVPFPSPWTWNRERENHYVKEWDCELSTYILWELIHIAAQS